MIEKYTTNTVIIALAAVWVALMLAMAVMPVYPIFGTPAQITLSSILFSSLTSPLLGPLWGTVSGFIFGWLVPFVNPATSMGLFTFLGPTLGALMGGLFLFNRWKEATLIFGLEMLVWFAHPFAWYELMPLITWQSWLVLILIVVPPIREWVVNALWTQSEKRLPIALWCLAWVARIGGEVATSNNNAVWILGWGTPEMYPFWAPLTVYYAIADSLNCLAGAIIGTAVLLALKRRGIKILAVDFLKATVENQK
jgi:predicted membrane protein